MAGVDYRIVDLKGASGDPERGVEVRRFDSAYRAMDAMRDALSNEPERARCWHLIDGTGRILLRPDDIDDRAA